MKYKESDEIIRNLSMFEKEESSLKDKFNQKINRMEEIKKEIESIDLEIPEIKKSIETLKEQESMIEESLSQYDIKELVQKRDELSGNLGKIL